MRVAAQKVFDLRDSGRAHVPGSMPVGPPVLPGKMHRDRVVCLDGVLYVAGFLQDHRGIEHLDSLRLGSGRPFEKSRLQVRRLEKIPVTPFQAAFALGFLVFGIGTHRRGIRINPLPDRGHERRLVLDLVRVGLRPRMLKIAVFGVINHQFLAAPVVDNKPGSLLADLFFLFLFLRLRPGAHRRHLFVGVKFHDALARRLCHGPEPSPRVPCLGETIILQDHLERVNGLLFLLLVAVRLSLDKMRGSHVVERGHPLDIGPVLRQGLESRLLFQRLVAVQLDELVRVFERLFDILLPVVLPRLDD